MVALNAADGKVVRETPVASSSSGYSISGAPLVVDGLVVVGVAGGEYGIRGFLAAYDVSTGRQRWKFDTIPGPGEAGHDTWENDAWQTGGGGTWVTGSYDPSTDLLYWGVGNPSPDFLADVRPGDNLFTASVIALHASTGTLAWHFQFTPHDEHDWDSAQTPILADIPIKGIVRKVICWPNRNGFYYVLDRVTGEFLTGVPFVEIDWAKGLTSAGRPILVDAAKVSTTGLSDKTRHGRDQLAKPGLRSKPRVDIVPTTEGSAVFSKRPASEASGEPHRYYIGSSWSQVEPTRLVWSSRLTLPLACENGNTARRSPAATTVVCSQPAADWCSAHREGILFALDADTGQEVFRQSLGGTTMSPPISFAVDGAQVIAVSAGRALFVFGL